MSKKLWTKGVLGLAAVAVTGFALADDPQTQNPGSTPSVFNQSGDSNARHRGTAHAGATRGVDHFIVKCVARANREEIALGQLAQQRASSPEVKQFAMQMVQDHTRYLNRIESVGGGATGNRESRRDASGQDSTTNLNQNSQNPTSATQNQTTTTDANGQATTQPAGEVAQDGQNNQARGTENAAREGRRGRRADGQAGMGGAREFVKVMEEVAMANQQSKIRELSQKEGAQFDKAYVGCQIAAHMWMLDALNTFQRNATGELQTVIQEGAQTTQQHLTHAKQLMSQLEGQGKSALRESNSGISR